MSDETYILRERINGWWGDLYVSGDEHSKLVKETLFGPFISREGAEDYKTSRENSNKMKLKKDRGAYFKELGADKVTLEDTRFTKEPERVPPQELNFEYHIFPVEPVKDSHFRD